MRHGARGRGGLISAVGLLSQFEVNRAPTGHLLMASRPSRRASLEPRRILGIKCQPCSQRS